jgi:hypothetical protein
MQKKIVKAIFIIPFCDKDILQLPDTIASIKYYIKEPYSIICINDCKNKDNIDLSEKKIASENLINFMPHYKANWPRNTYGSLFCKKYQGMEYALNHFHFDFLIELDTDALVTGFDLVERVTAYFEKNGREIGLIGSYKIRADGKKRTRWEWALNIIYQVYLKRTIPRKSLIWNVWVPEARKNGYRLGDHLLGGAFVFSYKCISRIIKLYPYKSILEDGLYNVKIGDDVIFSLLTFACR